jgi:hypothetical protein
LRRTPALTLFFGETPLLGEGDADEAIAVIVRRRRAGISRRRHPRHVLPIDVQAIAGRPRAAVADRGSGHRRRQARDGDADRGLDGKLIAQLTRGRTRALPRDPESTVIGAAVEYRGIYLESWGTRDADDECANESGVPGEGERAAAGGLRAASGTRADPLGGSAKVAMVRAIANDLSVKQSVLKGYIFTDPARADRSSSRVSRRGAASSASRS